MENNDFFGTEKVWKILLQLAPPVMLAQLIQAVYNIVDSYFIGRYSESGLTALSVIFPIQLIIIAVAVGSGVGVNTLLSRYSAKGLKKEIEETAGTGIFLAGISWLFFAVISVLIMRPYAAISANAQTVIEQAVVYGRIVCVGSIGIFMESMFSKIHQAGGNMRLPMTAQIIGAIVNIVLDPVLIFGIGIVPRMGMAGAAIATVLGQITAAVITAQGAIKKLPAQGKIAGYVKKIYQLGYPSILMQSLYTVYIVALNVILAGFCDEAVTVLGLYYKVQTFFFIPIGGLQTCIVPVLSYNFACRKIKRCRQIVRSSAWMAGVLMFLGTLCFLFFPTELIQIFSHDPKVLRIGERAFRIIGISFIPAVFSLIMPVFFQAIGESFTSVLLSLTRQIFCLIPIFWFFSLLGLKYTWTAFPVSEFFTGGVGMMLYFRKAKRNFGLESL